MRVIALGPKPTAWGNGRCESADPARTQCPLHGPRLLAETALRTHIRPNTANEPRSWWRPLKHASRSRKAATRAARS